MMMQRLLAFGLIVTATVYDANAEDPFRIRVLSYNIHHGEGIDRKIDLVRIARVIQSVSCDVVVLQEVDRSTKRSGRVDQPAELARLTGMKVIFERNIAFEGGEYGNAVLSKLAIAEHRNVHLPSYDNGEQRGVLICKLTPPKLEAPILFLCTHLDHRRPDQERLASAQRINELIRENKDLPALLAGDLNATRDSKVLARLGKEWRVAGDKELPTIPVTVPKRQIDFILTRPAQRWKTVSIRVLDESVASDHRAIFAVLELSEN